MKRKKDDRHLEFIRSLSCVICGNNVSVEAAHIRFPSLRAGKRPTGLGEKPDDSFTVPLCSDHHREQHAMGEWDFWAKYRVDPIYKAMALFRASKVGDVESAAQIIDQR